MAAPHIRAAKDSSDIFSGSGGFCLRRDWFGDVFRLPRSGHIQNVRCVGVITRSRSLRERTGDRVTLNTATPKNRSQERRPDIAYRRLEFAG
ncbi:hypothetical protein KCU65_g189, partial [Aureobasidium melanogenum]